LVKSPAVAPLRRKRMRPAADAPLAGEAPDELCGRRTPREVTIVAHDIGPVRGMERQISALVTGLQQLGYKVTVIARSCDLPPDVHVAFHRVRGPSRPFLIAYPWFLIAGSIAVRKWRRGIVQVTGAIVLNRVDVIAVHYCHRVGSPTPSRAKAIFRLQARLAGVLKRIGERACFRPECATAFVCVSEGIAEEIRTYYPALANRVVTVHNGIDTASFSPGQHHSEALAMRSVLNISNERLLAAFVASEWERKGLASAIRALAIAREWDLVVAGGGDVEHYRALADSLGVGESVHWLGVTREVEVVYEMADAFVLPTSYESFSLVSFEAAASGLPILVTPVNGVRELIEDGRNGFLVSREPRTIAVRLGQLSEDPALRARLGRAARVSAIAFDSERMVRGYHELYARLAAGASG
jgi:glycosyltransferase involved in cell wall biosynthesis